MDLTTINMLTTLRLMETTMGLTQAPQTEERSTEPVPDYAEVAGSGGGVIIQDGNVTYYVSGKHEEEEEVYEAGD